MSYNYGSFSPYYKNYTSDRTRETLVLYENDPIKRLGELCKKGRYYYSMRWDKFTNGFLMECSLYRDRSRRNLFYREVRFVENPSNINDAKRVVSAILLDNIGLGVKEEMDCTSHISDDIEPPSVEERKPVENMTKLGMKILPAVLEKVCRTNPGFSGENFNIEDQVMGGGLNEVLGKLSQELCKQNLTSKTTIDDIPE